LLLIAVVVVLVLSLVGSSLLSLLADWYWFGEVGFRGVFSTVLWTRVGLFFAVGLVIGLFVALNLVLAFRLRPAYRPMSLEQQNLDRYRMVFTPRIRLFVIVISSLSGLIAGLSAQGQWRMWLAYANATPFGTKDPQFGKDVSFYMFEYPFYRYVIGVAFAAVVLAGIGALFLHWLYGGVRLQGTGERITDRARAHLWSLLALFLILKAVAYFFDRYGLVFSTSDITKLNGASYSDVHYLLPAKNILLFIAGFSAVMFLIAIARRSLLLPGVALALLGLSAVLIGGVFPFAAEQIYVKPNANVREAQYIERNIKATRASYGIDSISRKPYAARTTATAAELRADKGTLPNARLLDPNIVSDTFNANQQVRAFYGFNDKLDIDRYTVDGKTQDYVVGVRELDVKQLSDNQTNWINQHLVYTHGYGFVAAPANVVTGGVPCFISGFISEEASAQSPEPGCPKTTIPVDQPRIYYGELFDESYAVVGKRSGESDRELDRPLDENADSDQQLNTTYSGKGGVRLDSFGRKLVYALHFRERNFLLSGALNDNSKVIYVRDPRARVEKAAPFLTVDGDPYPAVVGGRVVWLVDAYTTSNAYPYAQREVLGDLAADSTTGTGSSAQPKDSVNYIRNSVKATVDAYDGTVKLYEWDTTDPVLKTWNKAFGGILQPRSSIPAELAQHFRYPEDLFKVQRRILASYHVTDAQGFFGGQDFWKAPDDPNPDEPAGAQPPFYLLAQFPGQENSTFQLTSPLTFNKRPNLAAMFSASYNSDGSPSLDVLELPGDTQIFGPGRVQASFASDQDVAGRINILKNGSKVRYGNLLTLPVGGGLLYVEPVYVESVGGTSFPKLQSVLVLFGNEVAFETSLDKALTSLFGDGSGDGSGSGGGSGAGSGEPPGSGPSATPAPTPSETGDATAASVASIQKALEDLKAAQQKGDFAAIGKAQADLEAAVKRFESSRKSATPSPSPGR
jgi:uncharacterized membrane protein (UPF0182 family)